MKTATPPQPWAMPRWLRPWEQFWFTPRDPLVLALIRVTCGALVTYTLFVYGFALQDFMGEHGWHDMKFRMETVREKPVVAYSLTGYEYNRVPEPKTPFQMEYYNKYRQTWGFPPPPPYPSNEDEVTYLENFHVRYGMDLRVRGLPIPKTLDEKAYAEEYTARWKLPPPAYPKSEKERQEVEQYLEEEGVDPRWAYAKGMPIFSIWFHVLDPQAMNVVHGLFVLAALMFTFGLGTRVTAAITWFANLCYIQRNPTILFGADTMYTILLLYLMIGPSGAAFSLDRVIRRWWAKAKPGVVQGWCRFWKQPVPDISAIAPVAFAATPEPSVSANVAIRLLQIHLCIIYFMAGTSKLLGQSWWTGNAIWLVIANYELAPMQYGIYLRFLRFLADYPLVRDIILTSGSLFTLAFELGYAFLIWRPSLRWVYLAAAIVLHGLIGVMMGLKTFALIMLVMNMAFLRKEEAYWLLSWIGMKASGRAAAVQVPTRAPEPAVAGVKA